MRSGAFSHRQKYWATARYLRSQVALHKKCKEWSDEKVKPQKAQTLRQTLKLSEGNDLRNSSTGCAIERPYKFQSRRQKISCRASWKNICRMPSTRNSWIISISRIGNASITYKRYGYSNGKLWRRSILRKRRRDGWSSRLRWRYGCKIEC